MIVISEFRLLSQMKQSMQLSLSFFFSLSPSLCVSGPVVFSLITFPLFDLCLILPIPTCPSRHIPNVRATAPNCSARRCTVPISLRCLVCFLHNSPFTHPGFVSQISSLISRKLDLRLLIIHLLVPVFSSSQSLDIYTHTGPVETPEI